MKNTDLPFELETEIEHRIAAHPEWQAGIEYGRPRPGHPEGQIKYHIAAVLDNVERWYATHAFRKHLRLITLIHDSFKHCVDRDRPRCGENHHGMIARRHAENLGLPEETLSIIELHDEAFNAWQCGQRDNRWDKAETRAAALLDRLATNVELYQAFYRCDNSTAGKQQDCFEWFADFLDT